MSDNYDLLCKVAMGLPLSSEDAARLGQERLIVTEVKTILTLAGKAALREAEAAKADAITVNASDMDALLRAYPKLVDGETGMPAVMFVGDPETFHGLGPFRRANLVEVGVMATIYEWGDSPHERRKAPGSIVRLSRHAADFIAARAEHTDAA